MKVSRDRRETDRQTDRGGEEGVEGVRWGLKYERGSKKVDLPAVPFEHRPLLRRRHMSNLNGAKEESNWFVSNGFICLKRGGVGG